ncbi:hypothetical protein T439DRAFT_324012 [Meredithblackwellia eburnea MCA 4105]
MGFFTKSTKAVPQDDEAQSLLANPPPPYPEMATSSTTVYPVLTPTPQQLYIQQPVAVPAPAPTPAPAPSTRTNYQTLPVPVCQHHHHHYTKADRRARCRFCGALFWALAIWLAITVLVHGASLKHQKKWVRKEWRKGVEKGREWKDKYGHDEDGKWAFFVDGPRPAPEHSIACNGFKSSSSSYGLRSLHPVLALLSSSSAQTASATYSLPLESADDLFIRSAGQWAEGDIEITVDDSLVDEAKVDVLATFEDEALFANSSLCVVREDKVGFSGRGKSGLDLWTPSSPLDLGASPINFRIVLHVPSVALSSFTTSASNFTLSSSDLTLTSTLVLQTTNRAITVSRVSAESITLQTTNGVVDIARSSAVTQLVARTTNADIVVRDGVKSASVILNTSNGKVVSSGSAPIEVGKTLALTTSVAPVDVAVALVGSSVSQFDVTVKSTDGAVNVEVVDLPVGAKIRSFVMTSNEVAKLTLPALYEGSFTVTTNTPFTSLLDGPRSQSHPTDPSLTRQVLIQNQVPGTESGRVWWASPVPGGQPGWSPAPYAASSAVVRSSGGDASLVLL